MHRLRSAGGDRVMSEDETVQSRHNCPSCDGIDTERVEVVFERGTVIEVRSCNDCYAGYNLEYSDPTAEVYHEPEVEA